jgi:hypothetical protein
MSHQQTVLFRKIKKGDFFRSSHTPKRLYQKYNGWLAQVVAGPGVGQRGSFHDKLVVPVTANIIINNM